MLKLNAEIWEGSFIFTTASPPQSQKASFKTNGRRILIHFPSCEVFRMMDEVFLKIFNKVFFNLNGGDLEGLNHFFL